MRESSYPLAGLRQRIARLAVWAPRRIIIAAALLAVIIGAFGVPVADKLSPSGFRRQPARCRRIDFSFSRN